MGKSKEQRVTAMKVHEAIRRGKPPVEEAPITYKAQIAVGGKINKALDKISKDVTAYLKDNDKLARTTSDYSPKNNDALLDVDSDMGNMVDKINDQL